MCFTLHDDDTAIVAGIFHEAMNMPVRLKELHAMGADEIAVLQDEIDQEVPRQRSDN